MDPTSAVAALGALAHDTRLSVFRLLVECGPDGLSAGVIAQSVGLAPSSLTFHLHLLTQAGLVTQRRMGRQMIYTAHFVAMHALVAYLTQNCCGGAACGPLLEEISA
jgi:DNA-binding transcriptional ArsR family regulator